MLAEVHGWGDACVTVGPFRGDPPCGDSTLGLERLLLPSGPDALRRRPGLRHDLHDFRPPAEGRAVPAHSLPDRDRRRVRRSDRTHGVPWLHLTGGKFAIDPYALAV